MKCVLEYVAAASCDLNVISTFKDLVKLTDASKLEIRGGQEV